MAAGAGVMLSVGLVSTLALLSAAQSRGRFAVCRVACCEVYPSCDEARSLHCECDRSGTSLTFYKRDLPATLETIFLSKVRDISIYSLTPDGLLSLRNVTFIDVKSLSIYGGGLKLQKDSALESLNIINVQSASIYTSALSGHWDNRTSIRIRDVGSISIYNNAFNFSQSSQGANLELGGVGSLSLYGSLTKSASFSRFVVTEMTISTCSGKIFGKNVYHLELNAVKIDEVVEGCVSGSLKKLLIRSSHLKSVEEHAFLGSIEEIVVDNSYIGTVHSAGFQVQVKNMSVTDSSFGSLWSRGLNVLAENAIRFENVWMANIQRNALAGLRIGSSPNTTDATRPLVLRHVRATDADAGSLVFHEGISVCMEDLEIRSSRPDLTRPATWARALVGDRGTEDVTMVQQRTLRQLWRSRPDLLETLANIDDPVCDSVADDVTTDDGAGAGAGAGDDGAGANSRDSAGDVPDEPIGGEADNDVRLDDASTGSSHGDAEDEVDMEKDDGGRTGTAAQVVLLGILLALIVVLVFMVGCVLRQRGAPHTRAAREASGKPAAESSC